MGHAIVFSEALGCQKHKKAIRKILFFHGLLEGSLELLEEQIQEKSKARQIQQHKCSYNEKKHPKRALKCSIKKTTGAREMTGIIADLESTPDID